MHDCLLHSSFRFFAGGCSKCLWFYPGADGCVGHWFFMPVYHSQTFMGIVCHHRYIHDCSSGIWIIVFCHRDGCRASDPDLHGGFIFFMAAELFFITDFGHCGSAFKAGLSELFRDSVTKTALCDSLDVHSSNCLYRSLEDA